MENTYLYINNSTSVYYNSSKQKYYVANTLQKHEESVTIAEKAAEAAYKIFSEEISKYISHFKEYCYLDSCRDIYGQWYSLRKNARWSMDRM